MFVESAQNFNVLKDMNFSLFGMGPKYRRRAERMKPNDQVLFYVSGLRIWPAIATIASTYFEDDTPLWVPTTRHESFRYRIKLKPSIVLEEDDYIDALVLGPRLDYVKRWAPQDWPLAFWDRLHLLPQRDFRLIESEMQRAAARHRRGNRRRSPAIDGRENYALDADASESRELEDDTQADHGLIANDQESREQDDDTQADHGLLLDGRYGRELVDDAEEDFGDAIGGPEIDAQDTGDDELSPDFEPIGEIQQDAEDLDDDTPTPDEPAVYDDGPAVEEQD
ncbi:MAG: hypothetical protein CL694_10165 [Chloroflexi bacterium]|jgi:hypothetical protein|nr:hypothetical protein [Chloroflexota bacterium]|tara:strand:+ start:20506 stop:21348 length:843 start_codon:yes stop_codon:yes gene_type:complete